MLINTALLMAVGVQAQTSTEMFETEYNGSTSFTDNGVIFNIESHVGTFAIQGSYPATGWNGVVPDNRYIDNTNSSVTGGSFSIKTTSNLFKVNRFWIFLSDSSLNQNVSGTLTITGKLSGVTKFTHFKTTGFATGLGSTNGYTLIDLTNLNGQNYTNMVVDEIRLTIGGAFRYMGLDAFTWVKDPGVIMGPCSPFNVTTSQTNVTCNGASNGTASVSIAGGPYTYSWNTNPVQNTATATNLSAGTYSVVITKAPGCQEVRTFTITQPAAVSGTTVVTNVACNGASTGAINLTPTGGVGPYTFNWGNGITTEDRTNLPAGSYSVTITDANGCTTTLSNIIITHMTAVSGTLAVTNVTCNGASTGAINLTPTGGTAPYTYNWGNGITTEDRTGLAAGSYSVTITDANGCAATLNNITVTQPAAVAAPTGAAVQSFTNGATLSALVASGSNIKWYSSASDAANYVNSLPLTTTIINNTTYYATQTVGSCESSASLAVLAYNESLGTNNVIKSSPMQIYPNPVTDILNIRSEEEIRKLTIYSAEGKKVAEKIPSKDKRSINVQSLIQGIYFIQVFTNDNVKTFKFIKK